MQNYFENIVFFKPSSNKIIRLTSYINLTVTILISLLSQLLSYYPLDIYYSITQLRHL